MGKGRLEAFTDGVVAIIITIMVLNLKVPATATLDGLAATVPMLAVYALSFANVGIFWNNHHHMLHVVRHVNGAVLWANLFLLFWLSLVPFAMWWIDAVGFAALPVASYGFVLLMSGAGYRLLERSIIAADGRNAGLAVAIGHDLKGMLSLLGYAAAMALAFVSVWLAIAIYLGIAIMWLVPDRRIERHLARGGDGEA